MAPPEIDPDGDADAAAPADTRPAPVIVDVNEPAEVTELLDVLGIEVVRQRLAPADYVVGPIAIERKSVGDFHGSLIQQRLFEQLTRLKETYPPPVALILEGDLSSVNDLRAPRAFWGALLAIAIELDVRVLPTPSRAGTAELLAVLATRVGRGAGGWRQGAGVRYKPVTLTPAEQQKFVVQGLPGIGDTVSHNLLERFGSLRRLFAANERELLRAPGVGKKRAAEISELLDRTYVGPQRRLDAPPDEDAE